MLNNGKEMYQKINATEEGEILSIFDPNKQIQNKTKKKTRNQSIKDKIIKN